MRHNSLLNLALLALAPIAYAPAASAQSVGCDKACLENLADRYRAAYLAHDPAQLPIVMDVAYSENHVPMRFPDGTWDTVSEELGPPQTISDPVTGQVAVFTAIMQNDTPGFLAIRLKVEAGEISEIEHIISTKRNLSSPPTPTTSTAGAIVIRQRILEQKPEEIADLVLLYIKSGEIENAINLLKKLDEEEKFKLIIIK